MKLVEIIDEKNEILFKQLEARGCKNNKAYNMDTGSKVLYSVENGKEHVSISHKKRYPTWDEVSYVRYKLMKPNSYVVQILPPREEYINLHENCFHLWEVDAEVLNK